MISPAFRENPPSPIRDAIHNYIRTTRFETFIIDTPEFQRLRDTLQNSTAFLTFPCNTHTRFSHSLGVMHVAGDMFIKALKNSHGDVLESFLKDADLYVKEFAGIRVSEAYGSRNVHSNAEEREDLIEPLEEQWGEEIGNHSRFSHNPELFPSIKNIKDIKSDFDVYFLINTLWQVVRIGALIHDLGHLPMSHIFEQAIKLAEGSGDQETPFDECMRQQEEMFESGKESFPNNNECAFVIFKDLYDNKNFDETKRAHHEKLGLHLFSTISKRGLNDYSKLIRDIVVAMLSTPAHSVAFEKKNGNEEQNKKYSFLSFIHSMFDNNFIDADRVDYCRRDPYFSGSELGAFDYERVINSSTMVIQKLKNTIVTPQLKDDDYTYRLAHNQKSINALESLLFQRHSIYTNIVYHHSISRMNAVVKEIIRELIEYFNNNHEKKDDIIEVMFEFGFFSKYEDKYFFMHEDYINTFDESWLKTFFRKVLLLRTDEDIDVNDRKDKIFLLIDTFLSRKVDNLLSVWKSSQDCQDKLDFNSKEFILFSLDLAKDERPDKVSSALKNLKIFFKAEGVVFIFDKIKLPSFSKNPVIVSKHDEKDLDSAPLKNLLEMSKLSLSVNFFLVGENLKGKKNKENIQRYKTKFNDIFKNYFLK